MAEVLHEARNLEVPNNGIDPAADQIASPTTSAPPNIMLFIFLPKHVRLVERDCRDQPVIDYSCSITLTTEENLNMMAQKSMKKITATKEREKKHIEAENLKRWCEEEKSKVVTAKFRHHDECEKKQAFDAMWMPTACTHARGRFYAFIKYVADAARIPEM